MAIFILGIMLVSLFAGFSSGLLVVQVARENLRATQIMMQKTEQIRLFTWIQMTNSSFVKTNFSDFFVVTGTNSGIGTTYKGFITVTTPASNSIPVDYASNTRGITLTVYWTNYPHGRAANAITRSRTMQTLVARYGMQDYVYR